MYISGSALERFFANMIDGFFIQALATTITFLTTGVALFQSTSAQDGGASATGATLGGLAAASGMIATTSFVLYIIYLIITALLISRIGSSPGKKVAGLRIVGLDGRNLSFGRALIRELFKLVSALPLGLGFSWMLFDRKKQTWHDKIAKSVVLREIY